MLRRCGSAVLTFLIVAAVALVSLALARTETSRFSPVPPNFGMGAYQNDAPAAEEPEVTAPEEDEPLGPDLPFEEAPTKLAASDSQWKIIGEDEIWSVAWSPDGKRVAFVTVDDRGDEEAVEGRIISRAIVWLMENPGTGSVHFRRLVRRTMKQGLPIGLFWLSDEEVGWSTPDIDADGSALYAARLSDGRVRRITRHRVDLHYIEHAGSEPYDGPRDLYLDRVAHRLFLVGYRCVSDQDQPPIHITSYNPANDSIETRRTSLTGNADICAFTGSDGKTSIYLCGWDDSPPTPKAYVWPSVSKIEEGVPQGEFIRVSPDGKTISWLRWRDRGHALVFYDLAKKTAKEVALWQTFNWMEPRGCPYSWSPDGKQIAYADGSTIKIVQVDSK